MDLSPLSIDYILTYLQVSDGKILENDIPVFIITFATQELMVLRNAKTGEAMVGAENKVEQCTYVAAITRVPEDLNNEITGGWKVIEVCSTLIDQVFLYIENFLLDGATECAGIPLKVDIRFIYTHI